MSPRSGEAGSILPLVIFFGVLALIVVLLVVATTSLYLERKRPYTLADGAAVVGAEAFELTDVVLGDGGPQIVLSSAAVAAAVTQYLDEFPVTALEAVSVEEAGTSDGSSATVVLSSYWRPPILSLLVPEGFRIQVTAVARSAVY